MLGKALQRLQTVRICTLHLPTWLCAARKQVFGACLRTSGGQSVLCGVGGVSGVFVPCAARTALGLTVRC